MPELPGLIFDDAYLKAIENRVYEKGSELSAAGHKIVGLYCAFTPKELVAAAGGIPVSLCAGTEDSFPAAERHLPPNLCPLIKSSYGHALADTCPYFDMTDFLLADATCDGKKKMFELLPRIRPLHLLQLPQSAEGPGNLAVWEAEIWKARTFLEERTGQAVTDKALAGQIKKYNRLRSTVESVYRLNTGSVPVAYGSEISHITAMGGFECDLDTRVREMEAAKERILERSASGPFPDQMRKRPRVLLTGCPTTNRKVLHLIEQTGGAVVAMETCGGLKSMGRLVDEDRPPMKALAEKYLGIACACMTPNLRRLDLIGELIRDFRVDGVIDLTWNACHTYNVEAFSVKEAVQEHRPYLQILTDYSENDRGQLETRIEAFLEIITP